MTVEGTFGKWKSDSRYSRLYERKTRNRRKRFKPRLRRASLPAARYTSGGAQFQGAGFASAFAVRAAFFLLLFLFFFLAFFLF